MSFFETCWCCRALANLWTGTVRQRLCPTGSDGLKAFLGSPAVGVGDRASLSADTNGKRARKCANRGGGMSLRDPDLDGVSPAQGAEKDPPETLLDEKSLATREQEPAVVRRRSAADQHRTSFDI